ncbi:hypothetical protein ACTNDG_13325, partial [Clostridium sp. HCP1S3_B4]
MSFKEAFKDEYVEIDISNNEEAKAFFEENVYKREREILKKSDGLFKCIKEVIVMIEIDKNYKNCVKEVTDKNGKVIKY